MSHSPFRTFYNQSTKTLDHWKDIKPGDMVRRTKDSLMGICVDIYRVDWKLSHGYRIVVLVVEKGRESYVENFCEGLNEADKVVQTWKKVDTTQ